MTTRRSLAAGLAGLAAAPLVLPRLAAAQTTVGVTAGEIRIGNTMAYSGPLSGLGVVQGRTMEAYFRMVNDQGGIAGGRKIKFLSYDDAYSPPKTVEQVRRLVEQDQVACLFSTARHADHQRHPAIREPARRCRTLFPSTGADKWSDYAQHFPG